MWYLFLRLYGRMLSKKLSLNLNPRFVAYSDTSVSVTGWSLHSRISRNWNLHWPSSSPDLINFHFFARGKQWAIHLRGASLVCLFGKPIIESSEVYGPLYALFLAWLGEVRSVGPAVKFSFLRVSSSCRHRPCRSGFRFPELWEKVRDKVSRDSSRKSWGKRQPNWFVNSPVLCAGVLYFRS